MLQKDRLASVKRQGIRSGLGKVKIVVFRIASIKELKASSWDESQPTSESKIRFAYFFERTGAPFKHLSNNERRRETKKEKFIIEDDSQVAACIKLVFSP